MTRRFGWAALLIAGASAAGCSRSPLPVIAHDPIPPPSAAYAARCYASVSILNSRPAACLPIVRPLIEEEVVVPAKG
jgi:hypothetical protein